MKVQKQMWGPEGIVTVGGRGDIVDDVGKDDDGEAESGPSFKHCHALSLKKSSGVTSSVP